MKGNQGQETIYKCKYCGTEYHKEALRDLCEDAYQRLNDYKPKTGHWYEISYAGMLSGFVYLHTVDWYAGYTCSSTCAYINDGIEEHEADCFHDGPIDVKAFYDKYKSLPPAMEAVDNMPDDIVDWYINLRKSRKGA